MQLDGSAKSAQVLLVRYDMDLDQKLKKQDYYGEREQGQGTEGEGGVL